MALGEQRDRLVPVLDLADRNRLQDVPPDQVAQEHDAHIGAVERTRLRQEAVQQVGVLHGLHVHGEAEVLGSLLGDAGNRGHRRTDMVDHHVLDVLRPDGREALYRPRPCRETRRRARAAQHGPTRNPAYPSLHLDAPLRAQSVVRACWLTRTVQKSPRHCCAAT